jgi:hypothetical protein
MPRVAYFSSIVNEANNTAVGPEKAIRVYAAAVNSIPLRAAGRQR